MPIIDQYSAMISQQEALSPKPCLIDGRTEKDWLCFLSGFASLINFYDENNQLYGNWKPFLLKDPVFLAATIAGTPFKKLHNLYLNTVKNLNKIMAGEKAVLRAGPILNILFDQLADIFMMLKEWISFMQTSNEKYTFKNFVVTQSATRISPYFWALNSLRQNLFLSSTIKGITPVNLSKFPVYSAYHEQLWKENKDKSPYWEILNLNYPLHKNTLSDIIDSVTKAGDFIFRFFHTVIHHANAEFEKIKKTATAYPDTVLLRSFISLLQIHQKQLNTLSNKHLDFYYKDILKQSKQPAKPDSAFIYVTLNKKEVYKMAEGSLFNAGLDAEKQPLLFKTNADAWLNPAVITKVCTLNFAENTPGFYTPYIEEIDTPSAIKKNEKCQAQPWKTFGNNTINTDCKKETGIAFASPLLLLREGTRTITFTLHFTTVIDLRQLKNANYYLSTANGWLNVTLSTVFTDFQYFGQSQQVEISLAAKQPPIENFTKNPDGYTAAWPLLKIIFTETATPGSPPQVDKLTISVNVTGLHSFQLYNNYGALSTKDTYPLFGPSPLYNSSFIIGSNEIFSKPYGQLYFELNWDKLPHDFATYYKEYNDYVNHGNTDEATKKAVSWWKRILYKRQTKNIDDISNDDLTPANPEEFPFNNFCFTVAFQLLKDGGWHTVNTVKLKAIAVSENNGITITSYPVTKNSYGETVTDKLLFSTVDGNKNPILTDSSFFNINNTNADEPDNSLQKQTLKYTDDSTSGFIRMVLNGPDYGFGSGLYPKVVSDIVLKNAEVVVNHPPTPTFALPANLPFTPKLKNLTGHYTASETYVIGTIVDGSALQCYLYSPFSNYKVYDSTIQANTNSINLYPGFKHKGYLYLQMDNVINNTVLNIYFELTGGRDTTTENQPIGFYYLSVTGWKDLEVLKDGTKGFMCSGVISINIPPDICNESALMPGNSYWIAIGADNSDNYADTLLVATNGFCVTRIITEDTDSKKITPVPANTITRPQIAIPEISKVFQPSPSFGGRAAEDGKAMNIRVSNRIKTKERLITKQDYFRSIKAQFPYVFYSKTVYNKESKDLYIYVVKAYKNAEQAHAFLPQINNCEKETIANYLNKSTSAFSQSTVSNFSFQYVKVNATITVKQGFDSDSIKNNVITAIALYMSPWIESNKSQLKIDTGFNTVQASCCISNITGVADVSDISLVTWPVNNPDTTIKPVSTVIPDNAATLLVPAPQHQILITTAS